MQKLSLLYFPNVRWAPFAGDGMSFECNMYRVRRRCSIVMVPIQLSRQNTQLLQLSPKSEANCIVLFIHDDKEHQKISFLRAM